MNHWKNEVGNNEWTLEFELIKPGQAQTSQKQSNFFLELETKKETQKIKDVLL